MKVYKEPRRNVNNIKYEKTLYSAKYSGKKSLLVELT